MSTPRREPGSDARPAIHPVRIGPVALGPGRPRVIVPLTGADPDSLREQAGAVPGSGADLAEWRADHLLAGGAEAAELLLLAAELRVQLGSCPLLLTVRTRRENGAADLGAQEYAELLGAVIAARAADALDVEMLADEAVSAGIVHRAHEAGIPVVGSHHDFDGTPPQAEMTARLVRMARLGADVPKLAVMPRDVQDVLALMAATAEARSLLRGPLITMSMGELGAITRLGGGIFGSCATFGALREASAPGQLPVRELRAALDLLGGASGPGPVRHRGADAR
ncbi:type I 3-dehydroquinate dehydratase [Brachybacterium hainanense]|uniref:3-dehydroquinate dehydratase n=1 Tax=Brachybacterium hainanense TaxID=1541174 RepID=A0ABV6RCV9_9MICO